VRDEDRSSLSVVEKLLLAAIHLEGDGRDTFTAEDLVVGAWRLFPDTFGLRGYVDDAGHPLYPDSNRVFAEIMGSKPVRKRGLLVKVGNKLYRLTEAGREHAQLLQKRGATEQPEKSTLDRKTRSELQRVLNSRAIGKYRNGREGEITFYDACQLWGISPRSSAIELEGRLRNFETVLGSARTALRGDEAAFTHGGEGYGIEDLDEAVTLHELLQERFSAELEVIGKRTDERRAD
jgi:hypothetical protein